MNCVYKWLNKEKARYYTIVIQTLKKNQISLNYFWGGCNSNRGGNKNVILDNKEELDNIINALMKRRKNRGYDLVIS